MDVAGGMKWTGWTHGNYVVCEETPEDRVQWGKRQGAGQGTGQGTGQGRARGRTHTHTTAQSHSHTYTGGRC